MNESRRPIDQPNSIPTQGDFHAHARHHFIAHLTDATQAARIADGPDEVHTITVARDWLLGRLEVLV